MLSWLQSQLGLGPEAAFQRWTDTLADDDRSPFERARAWARACHTLQRRSRGEFGKWLQPMSARMDSWYRAHPIEVKVSESGDITVVDPLPIEIHDLYTHFDFFPDRFPEWATLVRTLLIEGSSGGLTKYGVEPGDLAQLLYFGRLERVESFACSCDFGGSDAGEVAGSVYRCFPNLQHLRLRGAGWLRYGVVHRAPSTLRTLICDETLIPDENEDEDEDEDEREDPFYGFAAALSAVETLDLPGCVDTLADLRAFLSAPFPNLQQLDLGFVSFGDEGLALLRAEPWFPKLRRLRLSAGGASTFTTGALEALVQSAHWPRNAVLHCQGVWSR
jgi:hypothetical protein